jgi:excisionase family DNA binding protein
MALLTPEQAAKHLGIGEDTLRALRKAGEIPYVNVGLGRKRETPRYEVEDLDAWVKRRKTVASRPVPQAR